MELIQTDTFTHSLYQNHLKIKIQGVDCSLNQYITADIIITNTYCINSVTDAQRKKLIVYNGENHYSLYINFYTVIYTWHRMT